MRDQRPEAEARRVITAMLVLTGVIALVTSALPWDTSIKSLILIGWIAVMLAVLRRYRLEPPDDAGRGRR